MWATRVTMCVSGLPFVKRLTEHMCWYCESVHVFVCSLVLACVCEGVQLHVLGPTWQHCADSGAWAAGLGAGGGVRCGSSRGGLRGAWGGLPWPFSHQTQAVGGRWAGHSHCQRARGATGPRDRASQARQSSHAWKKHQKDPPPNK